MCKEVISAAEMKRRDEYTINEIGLPSMVLMERAALAVADELINGHDPEFGMSMALCVCGTGNNGGDGVAVARLLWLAGYKAEILLAGERGRCTKETARQLHIAGKLGVPIREGFSEFGMETIIEAPKASAIVDALFGIGLSRPVEGAHKALIEAINYAPSKVLSIDIPSGLSADTGEVLGAAVRADKTVTLAFLKRGLAMGAGAELCGRVVVKDIGIVAI